MAKKFRPQYSVADIIGLYEARSGEGDEERIRTLATKFRELCRLDRAVHIPKEYKAISREVRTPFVRDSWHRTTAAMVAKTPVIHCQPKDEKRQEYRDAANIAERADSAMLERMNKEAGTDITYQLAAGLVRDGESVLTVLHRPDAWARFPKRLPDEDADAYTERAASYKRGVDLPIVWRSVDRLSLVFENGEYGNAWAIDYGEFARPYLRKLYGYSDDRVEPDSSLEGHPLPEGLRATSTGVRVRLQFWTEDEWHVIVDGMEVPGWPKPNPYRPFLPYFRAKAYDSESLLYSLLFLVPRLDELLTMKLNWGILGAYPSAVIKQAPTNIPTLVDGPMGDSGLLAKTKPRQVIWIPGKSIHLAPGEELGFMAPPPIGKDLNDLIILFKSMIDIAGIPSVMRGISGPGDSGYLANQMRDAVMMAFRMAVLALQRQHEQAMEFTHWLISNKVRQPVYVFGWDEVNVKTGKPRRKAQQTWLGLAPEKAGANVADLSKVGSVQFRFRPTLITDSQAQAMIAMQLTNAKTPLYSVRYALETLLQEEDPDSIMEEMDVEAAIREDPTLKQLAREHALDEAGIQPIKVPSAGSPLTNIVDQFGNPMVPPGPNQLEAVPLQNQMVEGTPSVGGLTRPLQPSGGRVAGMYPGQPSGPTL